MAVNIIGFTSIPYQNGETVGVFPSVFTEEQNVSASGVSAQSNVFNVSTKYVRISSDLTVGLEFGTNPTAAANSFRLSAGESVVFRVYPGFRLAVITVT